MVFLVGCLSFLISIPVDIEYDPQIAQIITNVSEDTLVSSISQLSGEEPVTIEGEPDSIPCRYSHSPGCDRAALWLAEQLENRGVSVELQPVMVVFFRDVDILENGKGWSCSPRWTAPGSSFYNTTDGGRNWQEVDIDSLSVERLVAISDSAVWGVSKGRIIATPDGGQNWQVLYVGYRKAVKDVAAVDGQHGWAVGLTQDNKGFVVSTTDGWETWVEQTPFGGFPDIVEFVSLTHGWVASTPSESRSNNLWRTQDGGLSWDTLISPLDRIRAMSFVDSATGFLVGPADGDSGAVYKTSNGGDDWEVSVDGLVKIPLGIGTLGPDTVYVVGLNGLILFSPDGGASWQEKESGTFVDLNVVDGSTGSVSVLGYTTALYSEDGDNWQQARVEALDTIWNVVGTYLGETDKKVLITAHYDAASGDPMNYTPGADDNASGVSAVLESARLLSGYDWQNTLKFILFTGEEIGLLGSASYASDNRDSGCMAFLNADMIAYDSMDDKSIQIWVPSKDRNPSRVAGDIYVDVIDVYDVDLVGSLLCGWESSDVRSMLEAGMTGISICEDSPGAEADFNPFYHTTEETLDKLNTPYLTEVAKACVGWMAVMANLDSLVGVEEKPVEPVEDLVALKLSSNILRSQGWVEVSSPYTITPCIYDASGRRVKNLATIYPSTQPTSVLLDVSGLAAGVYWIALPGVQGTVSERFVVLR